MDPQVKGNLNIYFLSMLKDISSKNADGGESSHQFIRVMRKITLYDCNMKLGARLAADSIIHQLVGNLYI
jgi:hypothetical protein